MIKKTIALGLSILSLGLGFMSTGSALSKEDEERATKIQQQETVKHKSKSSKYKIRQITVEIAANESKIKRLEMKRSELDHELALAFQLKEGNLGWFEGRRIQKEIYKITAKIDLNEAKIKKLKEKRNDLDHELAVLFQLQEKTNSCCF